MTEHNQRALNAAFAGEIGETSPAAQRSITSEVLDDAFTRTGAIFDAARSPVRQRIDPIAVERTLARVENDYSGVVENPARLEAFTDQVRRALHGRIANQWPMQNGRGVATTTTEELGAVASRLRTTAQSELRSAGGDRNLGRALSELRSELEDIIRVYLPPQEQRVYDAARGQYRQLMTGLESGAINESSGNVSAAKLSSHLAKKDRHGFVRGQRDTTMNRLLHGARAVTPLGGGSDTAAKLGFMNVLRASSPSLLTGGAGAAVGTAAAGPIGGLGAALLAERVLPAAYARTMGWATRPHPGVAQALPRLGRSVAPAGGLSALKVVDPNQEDPPQ
jgi:hypothetical protein